MCYVGGPFQSKSLRHQEQPVRRREEGCHLGEMPLHCVYILQSISQPEHFYTGLTANIEERLLAHNEGNSPHTSKSKPWKLITYTAFESREKAAQFEKL